MVVKDMGLVTNVFNEHKLAGLQGHLAIGHTRYSTTGASTWHNAQPVYRTSTPGPDGREPVLRPGPQRQPDQHRRPGGRIGMFRGR